MNWTPQQQQIIDARNSNLLVAAAAGSGKTAVLVERIIQMVTDEKRPIDIDQLLVVTFTNAAASQMREKINKALAKKQEGCPTDEHLTKQLSLLHRANIMTIDSFCLRIVKEHFHELGLDPNFRIGDKGELKNMQMEVLDSVLEDFYSMEDNGDFLDFIACFGDDKSDKAVEDMVIRLASVADSYPRPMEWLEGARKQLDISSIKDYEEQEWFQKYVGILHESVKTMILEAEEAKRICLSKGDVLEGPTALLPTFDADIALLREVLYAKTYKQLSEAYSQKFERAKSVKKGTADEMLTQLVKKIRDDYKKEFAKLNIFTATEQELIEDYILMANNLRVLLAVTETYMEKLLLLRKNQGVLNFSDVEHLALELLVNHEGGATEIAKHLREQYVEILIDEYQDSNFLQEEILTSISGVEENRHNIFMVGDVKQSIYKFRMARPDLFMGKYDNYPLYETAEEGAKEKKIELRNNFRSRAVVLEAVNFIFFQIMGKDLGGIQYDQHAKLVPSFPFPDAGDLNISKSTELMVVNMPKTDDFGVSENPAAFSEEERTEDETQEYDKMEIEAKMIGNRILELVGKKGDNPLYVFNQDENTYKKASFQDIAILLRSTNIAAAVFSRVLSNMGIPVVSELRSGYLETVEIQTLSSFLTIIDNPYNDIELVAVLHSAMFGFTNEELARIRLWGDKKYTYSLFYEALLEYKKAGDDEETTSNRDLNIKVSRFFDMLKEFQSKARYMDVCQLVWDVLKQTRYLCYLRSMPNGERRVANVYYFIDLAKKYAENGCNSVFDFIGYLDKMKKEEIDLGEANVVGEQDDIVRIMTMHKSKGLEFPIVFVSGLGKQFNELDFKEKVIVHPDYYLSSICIDSRNRLKHKSDAQRAYIELMKLENIAEELRVLYVAMTRAKEKLILTGAVKEYLELENDYYKLRSNREIGISFGYRRKAKSFIHLITCALERNVDFQSAISKISSEQGLYRLDNIEEQQVDKLHEEFKHMCMGKLFDLDVKIYSKEDILQMDFIQGIKKLNAMNVYETLKQEACDNAVEKTLKSRMEAQYQYQWLVDKKANYTVSQLKSLGVETDISMDNHKCETKMRIKSRQLPRFMQDKALLVGAARGTAMHKVMEMIDFAKGEDESYVRAQVKAWTESKILPEQADWEQLIEEVLGFFQSDLAKRMVEAAKRGTLEKEKAFLINIPISDVGDVPEDYDVQSGDTVLLQGVIDAYFVDEDGKVVIVDYKSDRGHLPKSYNNQLSIYARCLTRLIKKEVKEKYLYAFVQKKAIAVDEKFD